MRLAAIVAGLIMALLAWHAPAAAEGRRVALVIGNGQYAHLGSLRNARKDGEDVARALEAIGYDVVRGLDVDQDGFKSATRDFLGRLNGADAALFYYAGHGMQVENTNYLLPVDAELSSVTDLVFDAVPLQDIVTMMERQARTTIVLLDSCRDNPFGRNAPASATRGLVMHAGLAPQQHSAGTYVAFAAQPGSVSLDGDGDNSPFATAVLDHIAAPGVDIRLVMADVREDVVNQTGGRQVPWESSSLIGRFTIHPDPAPKPTEVAGADPDAERSAWEPIAGSTKAEDYEAFLKRFPDGVFASTARAQMERLSQPPAADAPPADAPPPPLARILILGDETAKPAEPPPAIAPPEPAPSPAVEVAAPAPQPAEPAAAVTATETAAAAPSAAPPAVAPAPEPAVALQPAAQPAAAAPSVLEPELAVTEEPPVAARVEPEPAAAPQPASPAAAIAGILKATPSTPKAAPSAQTTPPVATALAAAPVAPPLESLLRQPSAPQQSLTPLGEDLALAMQDQLIRIGCLSGKADGKWGRKSRDALEAYAGERKLQLAALEPEQETLDRLRAEEARVCPLACARTEVVKDGACVAKTCAKGQRLLASGDCARATVSEERKPQRRATQPARKPAPKTGGGACFIFNGQRVCG